MQPSLQIEPVTGRLLRARQVLTAHHDARPPGVLPELIVIHGISLPPGKFGGPWIEQLFTGGLRAEDHPYFAEVAGLRVSAHALIRRDGRVIQCVPFGQRAWHAGVSSWCGREACNDFSIGIELEGCDEQPYEAEQYQQLAALIRALCQTYPSLSPTRVVGHSDIAPGRKTDPGASFDWSLLRRLVA